METLQSSIVHNWEKTLLEVSKVKRAYNVFPATLHFQDQAISLTVGCAQLVCVAA